jgi:hypothetical protein
VVNGQIQLSAFVLTDFSAFEVCVAFFLAYLDAIDARVDIHPLIFAVALHQDLDVIVVFEDVN